MTDRSVNSQELLRWAESLAGIARTGLGFTENQYERERFEEVLAVAADIRSHVDGEEASHFHGEWLKVVGSGISGYVTPKVAIGAVVGDDQGRLLLIQRSDSGIWLYPTGWADVGYSPSEVAVKEVHEETGIQCEVIRPIGIYDGLRLGFSRVPLYTIVFHCRATGGELQRHPQECLDVGWYAEDELPQPIANFDRWGAGAFAAIRGEVNETAFDLPRQPVWRGQSQG